MDESEIQLGELYRDTTSGFEGVAIAQHRYLHGCTRITLQTMPTPGEIKEVTFDAPALELADTRELVSSSRTGGPRASPPSRPGE